MLDQVIFRSAIMSTVRCDGERGCFAIPLPLFLFKNFTSPASPDTRVATYHPD